MGKLKSKAGRLCKRCPNFAAAPLNVFVGSGHVTDQHHPTAASVQICDSSTAAASAMTWGLLADRRHLDRTGGWIRTGGSRSL